MIRKLLAFALAFVLAAAPIAEASSFPPVVVKETLGAQLRRLRTAARNNNPVVNPVLNGAYQWTASAAYPTVATAVTQGQVYTTAAGKTYYVAVAGTTAGSVPTGTQKNVKYTDGAATFAYVGFAVGDYVQNNGLLFQVASCSGTCTPAASGSGPTPSSLIDNLITYNFLGAAQAPAVYQNGTHNSSLTNVYILTQGQTIVGTKLADGLGVGRWTGGWPAITNSVPDMSVVGPAQPSGGNCNGGTYNCNYQGLSLQCEATQVEVKVTDGPMTVIVDGRYVSSSSFYATYNTGASYLLLDFSNVGGRAVHDIIFEAQQALQFYSVAVGPNDTCNAPSPSSDNFGVALFGSSLSAGTNATVQAFGWNVRFQRLVGLPDMASFALGGTGLLNPGGTWTYASHALTDLANYTGFRPTLKVVFIEAPINDGIPTYTAGQITAAATSLVQSIRTAYPNALIVGVGSAAGSNNATPGVASANPLASENAFAAAFSNLQATGDSLLGFIKFESLSTGPPVSGSGHQNNNNGPCAAANISVNSGNASLDVSNGNPHLTDCGYLEWARTAAAQWDAIIAGLP